MDGRQRFLIAVMVDLGWVRNDLDAFRHSDGGRIIQLLAYRRRLHHADGTEQNSGADRDRGHALGSVRYWE